MKNETSCATEHSLDARGLNCPLPILRTRKALKDLSNGDMLRIISSDPGSVKDMESFCNQTGNELVENVSEDGEFHFVIRKSQEKLHG